MSLKLKEQIFSSPRIGKLLGGVVQSGRVANAYLFLGPNQAEIQTAAFNFAKALNCLAKDETPCDACRNCKLVNDAKFVDVISVAKDGASLKIEQMREVKDLVKYGPHQGKYLAVIINEADKLTTAAANSVLKILEEPVANVVFILTAATPYAILSTIKSRCHKIIFPDGAFIHAEGEADAQAMLNLIKKGDINTLFSLSRQIAKEKETIEDKLTSLLIILRNHIEKNRKKISCMQKIIMETIKSIKRKAQVRLSLDAMFLRLIEEI